MINRRFFLATSAAALAVPTAGFARGPKMIEFDKSNPIKAALKAGKTVFIDFAADWCSTCARQERVINALRAEDPAYDDSIVFVRVDWDKYGNDPVARDLNIPRRSTLVALKGNRELGRIVAGTSKDDIKALMDKALAASKSA